MLTSIDHPDKEWRPVNFLDGSRRLGFYKDCGICPHSEKIKQILKILNMLDVHIWNIDWFFCGYWVNPGNVANPKIPRMTCRQAVLALMDIVKSAMLAAENPHPPCHPGEECDLALMRYWQKNAEALAKLTCGMYRAQRVLPEFAPLQIVLDAKSLCDQLCVDAFGTIDLNMIICLTKEADQGCPRRP